MVSDFGLVEAIESGIVKIPRVPVDDNAVSVDVTYLNLWDSIGPELPKKSRKEGTVSPENLPPVLEGAGPEQGYRGSRLRILAARPGMAGAARRRP